jgi:hypothetical protein
MKKTMKKIIAQLGSRLALASLASLVILGQTQSGFADIIVSAIPVVSSGSNGVCPGAYVGYVSYTKTAGQGWGWAPTNTVHTATDTNRSDTKVEFLGILSDSGCNQTTVSVPNPTTSPKYRFTVYFPSNVPTSSYPIQLSGFAP